MKEMLKGISSSDLEKLRMLLSIIPGNEQKNNVTLRVFTNEYSNMIKQNRSNAYYVSVCSSFKHLTEFFGHGKSIQSIALKDMEQFVLYLQRKVKKGFRVYYRTIKAAFNKAKDWGYVKENYFQKVKLPKKQQVNPVFINGDELQAICNKVYNKTLRNIIVFAFYTGMRLDEIVNLRLKNVDLQNKVITVGDDCFTTKGRNQRFIPISEEAEKAIETLRLRSVQDLESRIRQKGGGQVQNEKKKIITIKSLNHNRNFVFCKSNGEKFTGDYISKRFKIACKAAGVDQSIHFHSLRHSFASNLVQKGVPLYTIKELLGHSSISTTEIYSHLNMDSLREAIKRLDTSASSSTCSELRLSASASSEMLDISQKQKTSLEENPRLQIFSINSGEKR
ncbi:MAG: tyrosine-type recombinase/integrase [Melioribacteraceae bacterium]|nr:tyrosine-type recombinase/integrase [Melioribacteraceae bacterium]